TMSRRWKLVLVLVLAWPLVAWLAARGLIKTASLPQADAVVVLSGSFAYIERSRRAAELYKEVSAPKVVLTNDNLLGGWSEARQINPLIVERAQEELVRAGGPAEKVEVLTDPVAGTHDAAVAAYNY